MISKLEALKILDDFFEMEYVHNLEQSYLLKANTNCSLNIIKPY
jgi:hypothetical protein